MKKFIIKKISNKEMERRHCKLQNIEMADGAEHDTTEHSTQKKRLFLV